jgi:hypothetical protein
MSKFEFTCRFLDLAVPRAVHLRGRGTVRFFTHVDAVPELKAVLPPTAVGKDYPYDGKWFGITPLRTGAFVSLGGYFGLTIGWIEGIELNFFGGVLGFDIRRPAVKLPGLGRLGFPLKSTTGLVFLYRRAIPSLSGGYYPRRFGPA